MQKGCHRGCTIAKKPLVFDTRTSFRAEGMPPENPNSQKKQFLTPELRFVRKGCRCTSKTGKNLSCFLKLEPRFVQKGCRRTTQTRKKHQFMTLEPRFVRKGCRRGCTIAKAHHFLTLEPRCVRKGCRRTTQTRKKPSIFGTRTSFRAKWWPYPGGPHCLWP